MKLISGTGWISYNPALQVPAGVVIVSQPPVVTTAHENALFRCASGDFYRKGDCSATDLAGICTVGRYQYVIG